MPTNVQQSQVLHATRGFLVTRAAALTPATTIQTIFNITGGRVLLTSLTGLVVVVMPGTVNTITVGVTPTFSGTSAPAALSSAGTVTSLAAGSPLSSKLDGAALVVTPAGGLIAPTPYLACAGAITITTTATSATGTIQWEVVYVALDSGAAVAAA